MKIFFQKIWPALCIFALWFVFSSPYFLKGLVPFPSTYLVTFFAPWNASYGMPVKNNAMPDTISQIYPWKKQSIDTWKSGHIPLWNPYSFSGTPQAANYQSAVFSPMNLLFFILPFVDAWSILILFQPLLAGFGMYVFLQSIRKSRPAALVGAIAFMFCGFMTTWMAYGTLGYAAAFLPWALWAVTKDFQKPSIVWKLLLSISIAISFLSGHFQISLYVLGAVLAYIIFESVRLKKIIHGVFLILYSILGVCLTAPQILLTLDAYRASVRSGSFIKGEVIPWQYLVALFSPDFYGNPVTRNDWFGHYAEWASYIGVIPLMLSLFAIRRIIQGDRLFFIFLALTSLILAYPTPFNDLLFSLKLPAISTSAASRIMVLMSFSLASLSAFGIDDLVEYWNTKRIKNIFIFGIIVVVIVVLMWGMLYIVQPFPSDKLIIAKRNLVLPTGLAVFAALLMVAGYVRNRMFRFGVIICFVMLTAFDLYRYASKWMPFESRSYLYPQEKSLTFLQSHTGNDRVFGNIGNEVGSMFDLSLIEGYDAMYQGRYAEFINASSNGYPKSGDRSVVQFDKNGIFKTEALQLLGVRYIYHRLSDGNNVWAFPYWEYLPDGSMKQIYSDEKYQVYEYSKVYPRAYLASDYQVIENKDAVINTLFSDKTNRRETLILETNPSLKPEKGEGVATITSYFPTRITIKTESLVPKLLFLSDTYDPGWHAHIDGEKAPIYRADYDFRAVPVPGGSHVVTFTYFPDSLRLGIVILVISAISIFVIQRYENRHI